MAMDQTTFQPGQRVRVTQQIPRQSGSQAVTVEGTIVAFETSKTGSWYAHSKDHKLWLERLELQKDDGERVLLNLDQYSRIDPVD
jgi:hypothetical protein